MNHKIPGLSMKWEVPGWVFRTFHEEIPIDTLQDSSLYRLHCRCGNAYLLCMISDSIMREIFHVFVRL
jgi:uncharacterized protein YqhQ